MEKVAENNLQTAAKPQPRRYEFDNSAKFYPIIATKKAQSLYCMGAVLKEEIDAELLHRAVNEVMKRFPSLAVSVEKDFFWYYLKQNDRDVKVFPIEGRMLRPIDPKETNGYWFRVSYAGNHMKIDMFHGLTDGTGTMRFLKAILMRYQELKGVVFDNKADIMDWRDRPSEEETEDGFVRYYKPIGFGDIDLKDIKGGVPLRILGTPVDDGYLTTLCRADANEIRLLAKRTGVSFTAYIAGVLAYTISRMSDKKKPIVMMIPVNLRTIFPSATMRNFVTFVRLVIRKKDCETPETCAREAYRQLVEKSSKKKMEEFVSTTVRAQSNIVLRVLPLFLKSFFVKVGRSILKSRQTIIFSNLGIIPVPEQLNLDRFIFQMNVSRFNPQNIGAVTIDGKVTFAFTRAIKETDLIDAFFENLGKLGVNLEIDEELSQSL